MNTLAQDSRPRGRPREFDVDAALDGAMNVFVSRGYAATSISDLTAAMSLTAGSIYKAFADKRGVFVAVLDRYILLRDAASRAACAEGANGREKIQRFIHVYASNSHGEAGRLGCLVIGAARELALFDAEIAARVEQTVKDKETALAALIREGQRDGTVRADLDADVTARAMQCLLYGMRVIGKTGRQETEMIAVAEAALRLIA
jgi:AcrR family transcriptional regulator